MNIKQIASGALKVITFVVSAIELYEFGNNMCQKYSKKTKKDGVASPDPAVEPTDNAEDA